MVTRPRPRFLGLERQLWHGPEGLRPIPGRGLSDRRKFWREGPDAARLPRTGLNGFRQLA
jgi:hypothetical protein